MRVLGWLLLPAFYAGAKVIEFLFPERPAYPPKVPPRTQREPQEETIIDPLDLEDLEIPEFDFSGFQGSPATAETKAALLNVGDMTEDQWRAMESAARYSHSGDEINAARKRRDGGYGGCDG